MISHALIASCMARADGRTRTWYSARHTGVRQALGRRASETCLKPLGRVLRALSFRARLAPPTAPLALPATTAAAQPLVD